MTTIHSNHPMDVGDMVCIQHDYDMKYYKMGKGFEKTPGFIRGDESKPF